MKAKFILNCPDDGQLLTRKQLVLKTFVWMLILLAAAVVCRIICAAVYMANGMDPMALTKFGGDPTAHQVKKEHLWKALLSLLVYAPLMEETLFRLPLSFKRRTVALWLALVPIICAVYFYKCKVWYILLALAAVGAVLFFLVYRFTSDEQWGMWRSQHIILAMWTAALAFGFIHLRAFSVLNLQVLPWALATVLIPMAGGCAVTYARVNLGFFWGVLFHLLINVPGCFVIIASAMMS